MPSKPPGERRWQRPALIIGAALVAGCLGLVASVAVNGPGSLLRSELGQRLLQPWLGATGLPTVAIGDPIDEIRLPDRNGRPQVLPRPGQALLINYWAGWCEPCRKEMPLLAEFAQKEGGGRPQVVGIALDSRESADAFLARVPVPFATLIEAPGPTDSSARLGNGRGVLPFSALIDAQGRLLKRRYGAFQDADELERWAQLPE